MGVSGGFNFVLKLVAPQKADTLLTTGATKGFSRRLFFHGIRTTFIFQKEHSRVTYDGSR
jgi:hypothetical protein